MTSKQWQKLRDLFPEIPEQCTRIKIEIEFDRATIIDCSFIPKNVKEQDDE